MSFQVKYRNSHIVVICHNTFIHCWLTKFSNSSGKNPILNPKYHLGKVFFLICLNSSFTLSCVTEADFKQSSHMDLIWPCASSLFQQPTTSQKCAGYNSPWALRPSMTSPTVLHEHETSRNLACLLCSNTQALPEKSGLLLCFKVVF